MKECALPCFRNWFGASKYVSSFTESKYSFLKMNRYFSGISIRLWANTSYSECAVFRVVSTASGFGIVMSNTFATRFKKFMAFEDRYQIHCLAVLCQNAVFKTGRGFNLTLGRFKRDTVAKVAIQIEQFHFTKRRPGMWPVLQDKLTNHKGPINFEYQNTMLFGHLRRLSTMKELADNLKR